MCASYLAQSNPATSLASLMAAVADARTCETLGPLVLHVREGQPLQLSVQQVQKMTWQELARIWKVSSSSFLSSRRPSLQLLQSKSSM